MAAPVYLYYQLDNFYQNHRRYVSSRSDTQLAGTMYTSSSEGARRRIIARGACACRRRLHAVPRRLSTAQATLASARARR